MADPKEVDRMIARFPRAHKDGYNGVVFSANVAAERAPTLREAAKANGLALIPIVLGNCPDRNYYEGVLAKDVPFLAQGGVLRHQPENPTLKNADFSDADGDKLHGWGFQDDPGVTTFVDHAVTRGGAKASLRMESIGKNDANHARLEQPIKLQPHRQYLVSFYLKSEGLSPANPEVKILTVGHPQGISFQTFHTEQTQDWKRVDVVFNSFDATDANFYIGSWYGKNGKMWWSDLAIQEIALMNVLRRDGCPVTVRGENGTVYEEERDFAKIVDPLLHPYQAYHEPPTVKLTPNSRIVEGEKLRVSYYHSILVYEDRLNSCLSEPKIFESWREEIRKTDELLHPSGFLMSHDEIRVINQCALCQSRNMTPGELLADNVHKAAEVIRGIRPDAEIWVWNDMFDPMHNAVPKDFYAVNGPMTGSWKGLDPGIGIANWNGSANGKNCAFFADLGLKQILSGYYDGDSDGSAIATWIANAKGVKGVEGAMYTTWEDNYDAMDTWATKAWGGGNAVVASRRV